MTETQDAVIDAELDAALAALARAPRILIALDFDGTLAPEVDVPDDARALPEARAAIERLRRLPDTHVAFVSGRALESLRHVTQFDDEVPLIGSHGLEVQLSAGTVRPAATDDDRARVAALRAHLAPLVDAVEGAWIEDKPAGFAVHTRVVDDAAAARVLLATVREVAERVDARMTVRDGKNLVEFSARDATKGDGLIALREALAVDAVLFAGDDVTDEDALRVLSADDVGIKVGAAPSVARHRIREPEGMPAVLARLADHRADTAGA